MVNGGKYIRLVSITTSRTSKDREGTREVVQLLSRPINAGAPLSLYEGEMEWVISFSIQTYAPFLTFPQKGRNARSRSSVAASNKHAHLSNWGGRSCVSASELQMRVGFYSLSATLPNPLPKGERECALMFNSLLAIPLPNFPRLGKERALSFT